MASVATASTSAASVLKDEMTSNKEQEGQKPAPAAVDVCDENKAESPRKRSSFCGLFSPTNSETERVLAICLISQLKNSFA
jgi:hypothetical protein